MATRGERNYGAAYAADTGATGGFRPVARDATVRLAVVLVNWRRSADTIECLESLLRSERPARLIVVDNDSRDGSVEALLDWASGRVPYEPPSGPLGRLTRPPLPKPVPVQRLSAAEALGTPPAGDGITLIEAGENLGFAGGNNLALKHALLDPGLAYFWCLNNDTVAEPGATAALIARMDATHRVGLCGTQVRYYHRPGYWQLLNGMEFRMLTGAGVGLHANQPVTRPFNPTAVARRTDFVLGASLAVSRAFLETVGFMEESYFLYFEEMDWSVRNRGRFAIAFAHGAVVFHKEGGSIGSSSAKGQRSDMSEYYLLRSRLKFYRRNYPLLLPLQYPLGGYQILKRLLRRQPKKALAMVRALLGMRY